MIAVGSDHAGFLLKEDVKKFLQEKGFPVRDFGTFDQERVDYTDYGLVVAEAVAKGECEKGILFCGTGVGMSITANKVKGIRAVVCSEPCSAKFARAHNDTNILALGGRIVGTELAKMIVEVWLLTHFEGGRHAVRVEKITRFENGQQAAEDVPAQNRPA